MRANPKFSSPRWELEYGQPRRNLDAHWHRLQRARAAAQFRVRRRHRLPTSRRSGLTAIQTVSLKAVANGNSGATVTVTIITVNLAPQFTTTLLPNGANGVGYSQQVLAEDGVSPVTFSIVCVPLGSSCLPPGLSINQNTGTIVGTPHNKRDFQLPEWVSKDNAFVPLTVLSDLFYGHD